MSDKMREEFEKWAVSEGMPITRGHYYDVYASAETRAAYLAWQAAQAEQAVPVVGEVVGYLAGGTMMRRQIQGFECKPLIVQPTHSITTAELERLRKDAERGRLLINRGEWLRFDHDTPDAYALLAVRVPYTADLSCKAMREDAIDAAIAAEGEQK